MKKIVNIFTVSLILTASFAARADIASVGYVEKIVNGLDIPTVNNGVLTVQQNGVNVATFGANAAGNATANIVVPTKVSDLENDSNFVTTTQLDARELTSNKAGATYTTGSETQYPSIKVAETIATNAANAATTTLRGELKALAFKDTVASANIDTNAVTTDKIAANAVSEAKLATDLATKINGAAQSVSSGAAMPGMVVTSITKSGNTITATMDYAKIPVGSPTNPNGVATIWIE